MATTQATERILTVSEVNRAVRDLIEGSFMPFWLAGEVGSLVVHNSGHAYLTLKDGKSQLRACWFGGAAACRKLGIANGSLIEVFGQVGVYEVRGEYQFNIRQARLAGVGDLQKRFEELKSKLHAEGLFDAARKKPIPLLPGRVGVVTSRDGAALRDFLRIIGERNPKLDIRIYPAAVQGKGAARQVAQGVRFFNTVFPVDVIVVTRGGGSMEDLWEFNEEVLARTIAASRIPVISAVGHEIDFTISDFVADLRVPTPSAAALLVSGKIEELTERLRRAVKDMKQLTTSSLDRSKLKLQNLLAGSWLRDPVRFISDKRQYLDELSNRAGRAAATLLNSNREKVARIAATLEALNPHRQLERGYAIVTDEAGHVVQSTADAPIGKRLALQLADGKVGVTVSASDRPEKVPAP